MSLRILAHSKQQKSTWDCAILPATTMSHTQINPSPQSTAEAFMHQIMNCQLVPQGMNEEQLLSHLPLSSLQPSTLNQRMKRWGWGIFIIQSMPTTHWRICNGIGPAPIQQANRSPASMPTMGARRLNHP